MANKRRHNWENLYIPQSMKDLLLFGCYDDSDVNESFDAFMISIHKDLIVQEWVKHRDMLMDEWKHPCLPYAESLHLNELPDREVLKALFEQEMKQ
jgi:hypothetical protein